MKKQLFLHLVLFLSGLTMGAQEITLSYNAASLFEEFNYHQTPTIDYQRAFVNTNLGSISVYNKTTRLNDSYNSYGGTFTLGRSRLIPSNVNRAVKIDSFNPYGADNIGAAVLIGVLNSLF